MRIIGAADEFWRLRLTRVDTTDDFDFEWHADILYRAPHVSAAGEVELWYVEALRLDDSESIAALAIFDDRQTAEDFLSQATDDLGSMTKSRFEEVYLTPLAAPDEPSDELKEP